MSSVHDAKLAEAIALLTKVSEKLCKKLDGDTKRIKAVDKTVGIKKKDETADKVDKTVKTPKEKDKPEQIVQEDTPVIVTSFGKKATETLMEAFGIHKKKDEKKEDKPEDESFLKKLLGPGTLLVLGLLGGFIASLLKGGWGDILKDFKSGNWKKALEKIGAKIYEVFRPLLHSLPIIGPMLSFWDAYKAFEGGNIIDGLNNFLQGFIGLVPFLPIPIKTALFAGMDIVEALLENDYPEVVIPEGAGSEIMGIILHAFSVFAKMPFLKRLPIIGSLFDFYDAYTAFNGGGAAGIVDGLLAITAGIAGLPGVAPGVGTAISIGVDVVRALIFGKQTDDQGNEKVVVRDWASDLWETVSEFITSSFPIKNLIQFADGIMDIVDSGGSWERIKNGLLKMEYTIPGFGMLANFFGGPDTADKAIDATTDMGNKTQSVFKIMVGYLKKRALNLIPESVFGFALRARVAKMFGVDMGDPKDDEYKLQEEANQEVHSDGPKKKTMVQDAIITPDGKIIQPHRDDTIIAYKPNGPLDNYFSATAKSSGETNTILKNFATVSASLWDKEIKILTESHKILISIRDNINSIQPHTIVNNNNSAVINQEKNLRDIQEAYINTL